MKELQSAIMTLFNAAPGGVHNSFWTAINGKLYYQETPVGITGDYCVYSFMPRTSEYYFSSPRIDSIPVQFDLYSEAQSSSAIGTTYGYMRSLFDDCSLSVTGYTHYKFQFEMDMAYAERVPEENAWFCSVQYQAIEII